MKRLGLIGGISPESTVIYYRLLNEAARSRLGGEHSANILLYTLDYGVMIKHYDAGDWDSFIGEVVSGARQLQAAGVDALVITSNTTHIAANDVAKETGLPVVHLLDALVGAMTDVGSERPLLLGTPVVMQPGFYREALADRFEGHVLIPASEEQAIIGDIILNELVNGIVKETSREKLLGIINKYECDGVILGCTELCMILNQELLDIPAFDTTALHARAVSDFAFEVM